ncbi:MAG: hypothetical protein ACRDLR_07905 [Gaiellaceae bacterium]
MRQLEHADRFRQQLLGAVAKPEVACLLLAVERVDRDRIELADRVGVVEAVAQHVLAVTDLVRSGEACEQAALCLFAQEGVAGRHHVEEGVELEVLLEVVRVGGERLLGVG